MVEQQTAAVETEIALESDELFVPEIALTY